MPRPSRLSRLPKVAWYLAASSSSAWLRDLPALRSRAASAGPTRDRCGQSDDSHDDEHQKERRNEARAAAAPQISEPLLRIRLVSASFVDGPTSATKVEPVGRQSNRRGAGDVDDTPQCLVGA